ncbi:hypothetical protein PILCRDRAFT_822287 [Piloderma croceum F 1598]|uniref:SMP-30/Gluconolactonase/LRE-like region domain-containing protein n=1 Tax=Piloderma croceum (strain F 1598) TaxID=765440 RepID=A0A0C3B2X0_PILCF|nr:hypothetical protein PILCRDRAFT_822287 [Piloderma croceum F 1598]
MKLFVVLVGLVASSYAKKSCSVPAIPRNVTIFQHDEPIVPGGRLPPPNPASKSDQIVDLVQKLGRTTNWTIVDRIELEGPCGEPEGIVKMGDDRFFVSSGMYTQATMSFGNGTIINGTDRTPGAGQAHMLVFDGKGKRLADAALSSSGDMLYHTGGFDYDGKSIWATIAQYRPNSTAHVVRVDPQTLDADFMFSVDDHEGGIVMDTKTDQVLLLNWGSRNASKWQLDKHCDSSATHIGTSRNPSFYVDYQDCKFLGHPRAYDYRPVMICSGVTALTSTFSIGGIAIVSMDTMTPLDEVPISVVSDAGAAINQNPMDVDVVDGKLRLYLAPDVGNTTVYVLEAQTRSPYEF